MGMIAYCLLRLCARLIVGRWMHATMVHREQDGREAFLSASDSSTMDQHHRTTFCELERRAQQLQTSHFYGQRVVVIGRCFFVGRTSRGGGRLSRCLTNGEMKGGAFWFRRLVCASKAVWGCRSFTHV